VLDHVAFVVDLELRCAYRASMAADILHGSDAHVVSTVICVVASGLAGLGIGFFSCLLSSADKMKRLNGGQHSKSSRRRFMFGAIGSIIFGLFSVIGLYFGPVTLVTVVRAGSTLPANALFSQIFHLRPLKKEDLIGMLVTLSAVISFAIFQGRPGQNLSEARFIELSESPAGVAWNTLLIFFLLMGGLYMAVPARFSNTWLTPKRCSKKTSASVRDLVQRSGPNESNEPEALADNQDSFEPRGVQSCASDGKKWHQEISKVLAVSLITSCSSGLMDVATKGWSAALRIGLGACLTSLLFWSSLLLNLLFNASLRVGTIIGQYQCDVLLFIPFNTVMNILVSVATGWVVLDEASHVRSWPGIVSSALSMVGGILMLVLGPAESEQTEESNSKGSDSASLQAQTGEENLPDASGPSDRAVSTASQREHEEPDGMLWCTHHHSLLSLMNRNHCPSAKRQESTSCQSKARAERRCMTQG